MRKASKKRAPKSYFYIWDRDFGQSLLDLTWTLNVRKAEAMAHKTQALFSHRCDEYGQSDARQFLGDILQTSASSPTPGIG